MAGRDARAREGGVVRLRLCTVIVSYNRLPLLKETVFSYLATVTMPFSLVVVDNGSDDETRRWLKNSNLRVIYLGENHYPGYATNRGWEAIARAGHRVPAPLGQ